MECALEDLAPTLGLAERSVAHTTFPGARVGVGSTGRSVVTYHDPTVARRPEPDEDEARRPSTGASLELMMLTQNALSGRERRDDEVSA